MPTTGIPTEGPYALQVSHLREDGGIQAAGVRPRPTPACHQRLLRNQIEVFDRNLLVRHFPIDLPDDVKSRIDLHRPRPRGPSLPRAGGGGTGGARQTTAWSQLVYLGTVRFRCCGAVYIAGLPHNPGIRLYFTGRTDH